MSGEGFVINENKNEIEERESKEQSPPSGNGVSVSDVFYLRKSIGTLCKL